MTYKEEIDQEEKELGDAARSGNVLAQWRYAHYLMTLSSTYKKYVEGLTYLILAATQGCCLAQIDLAYIEFYGKGCQKDVEDALFQCDLAISTSQDAIEHFKATSCREDLLFWLTQQHRAVRLREHILKLKSLPQTVSSSQLALFQALDKRDWSKIIPLFDENVTLSFRFHPPFMGKAEIVNWFEDKILKKNYQVSLVPTERYGKVVEIYIPNEMGNIMRSLFLIRTNKERRIESIAHQAYDGGKFCFSPANKPFPWEEIEPCLNDQDDRMSDILVEGRMFCMSCGKLSHELRWIRFHSNPMLHNGFTYTGTMSVCTDCKEQVEFCWNDCRLL